MGLYWVEYSSPNSNAFFPLSKGFGFEQGFKEATQCCHLISFISTCLPYCSFMEGFIDAYMGYGRSGSVGASFHIGYS